MTLKEYAQIVGNGLVTAHNNKDMVALNAEFKDADQTLERSHINPDGRKAFWEEVYEVVNSGGLLIEKQANSALIILMQAIQREIAARTGQGK